MNSTRKEIKVIEFGKTMIFETPAINSQAIQDDEVLVKFDCACLDPVDWMLLHGKFSAPVHLPFRLGVEALGRIEQVGKNVPKELIGRKCFVCSLKGTYATQLLVNRNEVFVLDQDTDAEAASENFLLNPITAYEMVQMAKQRNAKCIVHTAACSNVGKWITVIAKNEGIDTIAVVRNEKHLEELSALGASFVLNSSDNIYEMALKTAVNQYQPTVLLDALGGDKPMSVFALMPPGSTLISYGSMEKNSLDGVFYGSLLGGKSVWGFGVLVDTLPVKPNAYIEQTINKLLKLKNRVKQPIIFFNFEDIADMLQDWPKRTTRLGIEAKQ